MAIRFHCPACQQLIETDDTDAGEHVICFYCRAMVTVPRQSEVTVEEHRAKVARPGPAELRHISEVQAPPSLLSEPHRGSPAAPPGGSAWIGKVGLFLALVSVILIVIASTWMYRMFPIMREAATKGMSQRELNARLSQRLQELLEESPGDVALLGLATMGGMGLAVLGFIVCLVALAKGSGKGFALAGLLLLGAILVLQCMGGGGVLSP